MMSPKEHGGVVMKKFEPKPKRKKDQQRQSEALGAFDIMPREIPPPYNKTIEAAELAQADDEKYGPVTGTLRERMGDTATALERGLRRLALGIAIAEHDKNKKGE